MSSEKSPMKRLRENYRGFKNFVLSESIFLSGMVMIGILFVYCWLAYFGNGLECYTDIVMEFTSIWNSNKSAERNLVYALALLGTGAIFAYYSIYKNPEKIPPLQKSENEDDRSAKILITALTIAISTYYFVYVGTNPILLSMLILTFTTYVIDKRKTLDTVLLFIGSLYAVAGIYRLYVLLGAHTGIDVLNVVLISFTVSFFLFGISVKTNNNLLTKTFLLVQLFIPFTLLVYVASDYKIGEEITTLVMPRRITYLVWLMISSFFVLSILKLVKNWNNQIGIKNMLSFGTLVCVMSFNNYSGSGQIISSDLHHPFENIIGFSQIVELGQIPFAEYIPVSGMYSFVQGFYLWLFGQGYYAYYYVTENLYYLTITFLIVWLLRKHIRDEWVLFVCLLVPIQRYNRVALIIPIMLLLALPELIRNKNLWLKAWLLTSLIHGLYYPLYGAAVCLGYLPLAIYQAVTFIRGGFTDKKKDVKFWGGWILTAAPILLSVPLLLGTLKHMMAMSGQTVYADGIARFGQTLPKNFFPYIESIGMRLLTYDVFTFLIQAAVVWVSAYLLVRIGGVILKNKRIECDDIEASTLAAVFGIAMLVAFSFTLIRIDINSIYARSAGMIYGAVVMIIIIAARYKQSGEIFALTGIAVFLVAAVSGEAIFSFSSASKLAPHYTVAEDYILVKGDHVPRLGECFVQRKVYDNIVAHFDETRKLDQDKAYLGLGNFGQYYLSFMKGDSVMETGTIKGFGAAQETVDLMRKEGSIANPVDSFVQYYFYHWLLMSGEYVWHDDDRKFYPNSEHMAVEKIRGVHKKLKLAPDGRALGRTPTSWGSSMNSLDKIFTHSNAGTQAINEGASATIKFDQTISGDDADFIYVEFYDVDKIYNNILFNHHEEIVQKKTTRFNRKLMKKDYNRGTLVTISWTDDEGKRHSLNCYMGRGKLLIPLGSGCNWLMNSHDNVVVTVTEGGKPLNVPNIIKAELLKVREVK